VEVTVVDSQQLSMGTGFMVIEAAKLARESWSADEILVSIDSMIPRAHVFAALESMTYLMKSGRINTLVGSVGNLLDIRPILKMNRGEPTSERVRTERLASARLLELLEEVSPVEQFAVVHTDAPEKAQRFLEKASPYIGQDITVESVEVTPVIGAHIGPGSFGFACLSREAETTDY
jgi:DegV family protein with EDD domain